MVLSGPMPITVDKTARMFSLVSAPLALLLFLWVWNNTPSFTKVFVDLIVWDVVASTADFIREKTCTETDFFPDLVNDMLLFVG